MIQSDGFSMAPFEEDAFFHRFVCCPARDALEWLHPRRADELIAAHETAPEQEARGGGPA